MLASLASKQAPSGVGWERGGEFQCRKRAHPYDSHSQAGLNVTITVLKGTVSEGFAFFCLKLY